MTSPTLTDNEIRVAIAEACGFERRRGRATDNWEWYKNGQFYSFENLPPYLTSLDAMHEAEKVLDGMPKNEHGETARSRYVWELMMDVAGWRSVSPVNWCDFGPEDYALLISASARSRALTLYATVCAKGE